MYHNAMFQEFFKFRQFRQFEFRQVMSLFVEPANRTIDRGRDFQCRESPSSLNRRRCEQFLSHV